MRNWIRTAVIGAVVAWSAGAATVAEPQMRPRYNYANAILTPSYVLENYDYNSPPAAVAAAEVRQPIISTRAATVTLDGTGSTDPDLVDTLAYAWTQTSGTPMTLSNAEDDDPTFTAPILEEFDPAETFEFSLIVTDDKGNASAPDTVTIIVYPPNTPGYEFEAAKEVITQVIADDAQRKTKARTTNQPTR